MRGHARVTVPLGVALVLSAAACGGNGKLFDDAIGDPRSSGSSAEPEPESPPPEPPAAAPVEREPDADEAQFAGQIPRLVERPGLPAPDAEPAPEPEPEPPPGPVIVSVSPEDGARGIENDAPIVLRFSEPMDRPSTEAAYQSELMPSRSVAFSWNDASTELTITPGEPLEYGVGAAPELAEARRVSFFISASASSAGGDSLAEPYESSFSLLRQVSFSVPALTDRAKSGNYRSNDSYGSGDCAEDEPNVCVGDVRVGRQSTQSKGFISFELGTALPADARQLAIQLEIGLTGTSGNPFAGLGNLLLEHVRFEQIGLEAFDADALEVLGPIASAGAEGAELGADVAASVLADLESAPGALTQYRLSFEDATDADNTSDAIISALDTQRLDVSFLVP